MEFANFDSLYCVSSMQASCTWYYFIISQKRRLQRIKFTAADRSGSAPCSARRHRHS